MAIQPDSLGFDFPIVRSIISARMTFIDETLSDPIYVTNNQNVAGVNTWRFVFRGALLNNAEIDYVTNYFSSSGWAVNVANHAIRDTSWSVVIRPAT